MANLFVLDDDEMILRSLSRQLAHAGHKVGAFSTAEQVLAHLSESPSLLVCDYHMPRIDGLELARSVKRQCPSCKVLLLSGGIQDEPIEEALRSKTIDGFLGKPFQHQELLATVDGLLGPGQ